LDREVNVSVAAVCPLCAEPVDASDVFCQACGAELTCGAELRSGAGPDPGGSPSGPAAPAQEAAAAGGVVGAVGAVPAGGADGGAAGVVGPAGVATGPRPEPGDEIGGVDGASVAFDAAKAGPPRRPGVVVADVDLDVVPRTCGACSGRIADDGYCEQCGVPAVRPRDHWAEDPASWVSVVCDRGLRHAINQDAVAVGASPEPGSFAVIVICDGVSSAARSEVASLAAARAARDVLVAPRADPATPSARDDAPVADVPAAHAPEPVADPAAEVPISSTSSRSKASVLAGAMRVAGAAAQAQALAAASDPPEPNPPACTFVAAVIENRLLVTGCVGDSRAYWLPDGAPAVQVSTDDSWASEAMALGLPREDAERAPLAHSITRWLGSDAPDPVPHTVARHLDEPGWVLVCSDGLWNYRSEAAGLHDLVVATVARVGQDGAAIAAALVVWANEQGGHDNISVALARID
jgi:serine/threonine protein phosphatase PrpC